MTLLTGQTIKGYEIHECIGQGAFGAVYRAYQPIIDREVAIKVILPQYANQPDFIRRFETEAQVVARLEHLHIVPLHDYWRDPDGAYLVMRYLRGGSLKDWIAQGALDPAEALRLVEQVAAALAVAHRHGIVHRDIKPSNILLDEERNAYLADFGIAKVLGRESSMDGLRGTLDYISPEQIRSQPVTAQTDVYALGIVLYEMLAGTQPFSPAGTPAELLQKHLETPLPDVRSARSELPSTVNDVIQTATAKAPAERYPDAPGLAHALREALAAVELAPPIVEQPLVEPLTDRELEVLRLLGEGLSNNEIASRLVIALTTVKWYVQQIYGKLGVGNRRQAVAAGQRLGLLEGAARRDVALPDWMVGQNPYKGLAAFQQADAADFFGREALVEQLVARLQDQGDMARFLAVVGPSGSGKSSVVRAGLLPALKQGAVPGAENWFVVDMLPGSFPLDRLEVALMRVSVRPQAGLMEQLRRDARGLSRAAELILPDGGQLLLVIDQFEELFTLVENPAITRHVLDLIYAAVTDPRSRVRVLVTLRADFYDRPLMYPDFVELMRRRTEVVGPLTPEELEQAIVKPAELAGVIVEPGLVAALVAEVHEQPGTLPLLEYALTELFDRRQGRTMTLAAYQSLGGALGVLTRQADEVFEDLTEVEQDAARQGFLRLVTLGEGTEDVRRRVLLSELSAISASRDGMGDVLDLFGSYRLLTFDCDPATREPTVEVAHEALIQRWERLREWIDASRADIRQQRLLAAAATEWEQAGREKSYLLTGSRLAQFEDWVGRTDIALTPGEQALVDASSAERLRQRARRRRVRNVTLAAALSIALIMAVLSLIALDRERKAQGAREKAETNLFQAWKTQALFLADLSEKQSQSGDKRRAILLAQEGLAHRAEGIFTPQNHQALMDALALPGLEQVYLRHEGPVRGATWNADETRLLTWSDDGTARVWDAAARSVVLTLEHEGPVLGAQWNTDETRLLTWSVDAAVRVWDTAGQVLLTLPHDAAVQGALWNADETRLLTWAGQTVRVWHAISGELMLTLSHEDNVRGAAWNPSGTLILTWSNDYTARIWDAVSGDTRLVVQHDGPVWGAAWNASETRLLTWSWDNTTREWDTTTGQSLLTLEHDDAVVGAAWNANETRLLTWSWDDTAQVWDATTGQNVLPALRHSGNVGGALWSRDETRILTWSDDGFVRVWDARRGAALRTLPHDGPVAGAVWAGDERFILSWSEDGTARIWNTAGGNALLVVHHDDAGKGVRGAAWSRDQSRLLTWADDATARTWDTTSGEALITVQLDTQVLGAAWNHDETRLLTWAEDSTVRVWSADGERLLALPHEDRVKGATWNADGTRILTWTGSTLRLWDARNGEMQRAFPLTMVIIGAEWGHDETHLLVWGTRSTVGSGWRIVSADSGETLLELYNTGTLFEHSWTADETRLLAAAAMNLLVWDTNRQQVALTLAHERTVTGAAWNADETRILSWAGSSVRIWDTANEQTLLKLDHQVQVTGAAWDQTESRLATWGGNTARIWDAAPSADGVSGQELLVLTVDQGEVAGMIWSQDGSRLLAWGGSRVWIWDAAPSVEGVSGRVLLALTLRDRVTGAAWNRDETRILTWAGSAAQVWLTELDQLMALAESLPIRPLTDAERVRFYLAARESIVTPAP